jgi:hypothetical protein
MKLYSFFNSTQPFGDAVGYTLTENGEIIGSHVSSCEAWAKHDLYTPRDFDDLFPYGWEWEFVSICDQDNHLGLKRAIRLGECRIFN